MRWLAFAALVTFGASGAYAQQPSASCKGQATEKRLAGAALKSFMTKCENDAAATCSRSAAAKNLAGAARTSHLKKCVGEAVGS